MARIGEILLDHGWVDATNLKRALAEQSMTGGRRLCSLLIARGLLEPDHAARALGEQHAVPAALQRHLENRDRSLEPLLSPTFARTYFALPIGRTRAGEVIVCVRDPGADVADAIKRTISQPVVIAVAPCQQLEDLIDSSYPPVDEFDVDLSTNAMIEAPRVIPDDVPLGEFVLADLDDVRVTKHDAAAFATPTRTTPPPFASVTPPGGFNAPTEPPKRVSPFASISPPVAEDRPWPRITTPPVRSAGGWTGEVAAALDDTATRDLATEVAMRYVAQRWSSSLLLAVKEGAALGHRGHGSQLTPEAIRSIAIPLTAPSIIQAAHDRKALATEAPVGPIQDRVAKLLGQPTTLLAAPIAVGGHPACILAVGNLIGAGDSAADLGHLAAALGSAYTRILRDIK